MALQVTGEGGGGKGMTDMPPIDGQAALYIQRKRISPSDPMIPDATAHFGQDRPGNFLGMVDVEKVNASEDPAGARTVKVVTKIWRWNDFHMQWIHGQFMFFVKDITDNVHLDSSVTVTGMPPVTVVSAPQLMALFDKAAKKYASDLLAQPNIGGVGGLAIDAKPGKSLVHIKNVRKRVNLLGVCYGSTQIDDSHVAVDIAVVGCCRCTNYWGEKARPGIYVGFLVQALVPSEAVNPQKNPLTIIPWVAENPDPKFPDPDDKQIFYLVGIVTCAITMTGFSQQYNIIPGQSMAAALGRFGSSVDTMRAATEYHDALGSVIIKLLPSSVKN
jgi:hypothetical protein